MFTRLFLRRLIFIFIPVAGVVAGVCWHSYGVEKDRLLGNRRLAEQKRIYAGVVKLDGLLQDVIRDLRFLAENDLARHHDPPEDPFFDRVASDWLVFARVKRLYDQIRWIDMAGMERVRINWSPQGSRVVPPAELQNKGDRYYFLESLGLKPGEIYLSPLDLNIEQGQLELPYKPMLRFTTPDLDGSGRQHGIIVLNYLAEHLLDDFRRATMTDGEPAWLVNTDGFWLSGSRPDQEWGFMRGRDELTVAHAFPETWPRLAGLVEGQFVDPSGLWTVGTVNPLGERPAAVRSGHSEAFGSYAWKVVSLVPTAEYLVGIQQMAVRITVVAALVLGLLLWGCWQSARIQQQVLESRAELQRQVDLRTAELHERNAELEMFLYSASHDLKTPLVTISVFLDLLETDVREKNLENIDTNLHYMKNAAHKMKQLIESILEIARIGRTDAPPVPVAFAEIVKEAHELTAGAMTAGGVTLAVRELPLRLAGDRARLLQIWQNLLENAIKYRGEQADLVIEIGAEESGAGPVFYVRDNGAGIDPGHQGKIFGLFDKLDPDSEGAGIGLALVKRIVEHYGGKIWVESAGGGQGSTFRFTLPKALNASPVESAARGDGSA